MGVHLIGEVPRMHVVTRLAWGPVALLLLAAQPAPRADMVTDWNETMLTTLAGQNPFAEARYAAITQLAVYEAVNAIERVYHPYLGTIEAPRDASAEAAAASAADTVLSHYFPDAAATLDAAL